MKNFKSFLSGLAGVFVALIGIKLGLPAPVAIELGGEAEKQIEHGKSDTTPDYKLDSVEPIPPSAESV